jgi:hypothetical protein
MPAHSHPILDPIVAVDASRFEGSFATTSQQYVDALERAAVPLIYKQDIIRFFVGDPCSQLFEAGQPVTVTVGRYGLNQRGMGYAFYGVVRQAFRLVTLPYSTYTVELHTVPGHHINWGKVNAQLWGRPPIGVRFVQPHAFLDNDYQMRRYNNNEVADVITDPWVMQHHIWRQNFMMRGSERSVIRPPPWEYYPRHQPHGYAPRPFTLLLPYDAANNELYQHDEYSFNLEEWLGEELDDSSFSQKLAAISDNANWEEDPYDLFEEDGLYVAVFNMCFNFE